MDQPYSTPKSNLQVETDAPYKPSALSKGFAVLGTTLSCALVIGLIFSIFNMYRVFDQATVSGNGDPQIMVGDISRSLVPMVFSIIVGLSGLLISLVTAITSDYRARWFFRWSASLSVIYLFMFPVGTLIAIIFLIFLIRTRATFIH